MAFVNMFNDRVEQFNLREENERLAELFSDEKLQEEAQWQAYSVKEISRLFSISEEEALKLMNCGLFKTYRVGNEYRASKKSVEENKKIVKAVLTYQDKKTMSVPDVMRILGLGKTATYRLINQCRFKTYLVLGKMRVDVDSFEDWYAGQFHYEKVNGERPGKKYGKTLSPLTVAKVLGIPRSTANDLMNDGIVEFIWVDGKRRIKRESFDKWYASQSKFPEGSRLPHGTVPACSKHRTGTARHSHCGGSYPSFHPLSWGNEVGFSLSANKANAKPLATR